jgi:hypothetical protein
VPTYGATYSIVMQKKRRPPKAASTTRKVGLTVTLAPQMSIQDSNPPKALIVIDFLGPGAGEKMCGEACAWKSCTRIERLAQLHDLLIVGSGEAWRLAL